MKIRGSMHVVDQFFTFKNRWVTFFGEKCIDDNDNTIEYYRVDRADSIIVLPISEHGLIVPSKFYRHGIQSVTVDFPGGRFEGEMSLLQRASEIVTSELAIASENIKNLESLNSKGWAVDSSFSTQRLFGVVAWIDAPELETIALKHNELNTLLETLECLQCRSVLMEWIRLNQGELDEK